jgi:hypothetical protein
VGTHVIRFGLKFRFRPDIQSLDLPSPYDRILYSSPQIPTTAERGIDGSSSVLMTIVEPSSSRNRDSVADSISIGSPKSIKKRYEYFTSSTP